MVNMKAGGSRVETIVWGMGMFRTYGQLPCSWGKPLGRDRQQAESHVAITHFRWDLGPLRGAATFERDL